MATNYSPSEVIHLWAQQNTEEAATKRRNGYVQVSFLKTVLYSYNTPIAAFREGTVFLDNYRHSATTSGHQRDVLVAVTQPIFNYDCIPKYVEKQVRLIRRSHYIHGGISPQSISPSTIWQQYNDIYQALCDSAIQPVYWRTMGDRLRIAFEYAAKANQLRALFNLDVPVLTTEFTREQELAINAAAAKEEKAQAGRFATTANKRLEWLAGVGNKYPDAHTNPIVLRVCPDNPARVETSRGAVVPLKVCEKLYEAWKTQSTPTDTKVGHYTLGVYDWGIRIGCHDILADEIERFGAVINIQKFLPITEW